MDAHRHADLDRKWSRLQSIGLAQFVAIPATILVIGLIDGFTIARATFLGNVLVALILFLVISGGICFKKGYDKRVELHKEDSKTDCPQ
jgi:hypothetical protein